MQAQLRTVSRCGAFKAQRPQAPRRLATLRAQASADAKFADYKPTTAFFFPGQGAQSVGMAKDLIAECPAAKELFDKAADILGYDLLKVCVEGPKEKLDTTAVSQPAIYVASLAAVEKLRATEGQALLDSVDVAAGLSLGEYTALAFAGAMSFEDGLKLVKLRGESMQAAADAARSGMVSVIGLDKEKVAALCEAATAEVGADKAIQIANFLCPGNYAVSGSIEGCEAVERLGKDPAFKARMTVRLAVAGAFHTQYMAPAAAKLQEALNNTAISTPRIPVISNVDAQPHSDPAVIKEILAKQLTSPVQWETSLQTLLGKGLSKSYEVGPGKVIAGIMKRIDKKAEITNVIA
uniref:Malonyl-CoA:ACP transacylase (MAT) domain-containing protein n=1 Tax=Tetradesmus obliquus TaxID=3088 RepID=A0A383VE93_TETOB|eukprot:jgi/Sobl393_1/16496/SZX63878.1